MLVEEAAEDGEFVWEDFLQIANQTGVSLSDKLDSMDDYAYRRLKKLGEGVGRSVYALDRDRVLKIAIEPSEGRKQNRAEIELSARASQHAPIVRVLDSDPKFKWLTSQRVNPIHSDGEFERATGMSPSEFESALSDGGSTSSEFVDTVRALADELKLNVDDIVRPENWGVTNDGEPVIIDYGNTH